MGGEGEEKLSLEAAANLILILLTSLVMPTTTTK